MLELAEELGAWLLRRSWILGRTTGAHFITSDHPLIDATEYEGRGFLMGLGLGYAQFFMFPLDPRRILVFSRSPMEEKTYDFDDDSVRLINRFTAGYAHHYVFQHPDDPLVDKLIPKEPREVAPPADIERTVSPAVEKGLRDFRASRGTPGASAAGTTPGELA
jgi:hypothetical protein